jgi:N-acetylmuramoyl-L-alanine amidase
MPRYPAAVDLIGTVPGSNFQRGPAAKIGFVVHVIEGSFSSAISEFQSPGSLLSAHFVVADTGVVWQLLDTGDDAYAQEAGNYPPTSYIAVEFEGTTATPMTTQQLVAAGKLLLWCAFTHSFPLVAVDHGAPGVTTHCHYASGVPDPAWGNHSCPGPLRLRQVPAIIELAKTPNPIPSPPPVPPPSTPVRYDNVNLQSSIVSVGLDGSGNGWHVLPAGFTITTVVAAVPRDNDPAEVGTYTPIPRWAISGDGKLVVEGGPPSGLFGFTVWAIAP